MVAGNAKLYLWILFVFFWEVILVSAQTQWQKHPNPVLEVGSPGSWDENFAVATTVLHHQGIYKMWYEGDGGFGYATSADGLVWTKDTVHNPIMEPGPPGSWDEMEINHASVLILNNTYHMWYSGVDANDDNRIGHAISIDGIIWARDTANPVLNLGTTAPWDTSEAIHPSVIFENDTLKMFYNGYGGNTQRILFAYSPDGINWTGYTAHPMLEPGVFGSWDGWELGPLCIIGDGNNYEMWYTGWDDTTSATFQIGYAVSMDGLNWNRGLPQAVLSPGVPGDWDEGAVGVPNVIRDGNLYKMWYGGFDGTYYQTGYATSLPINITRRGGQVSGSFSLLQNYPNPFNPITTITFQIPHPEFVTLKIYDILGEVVSTLVNQQLPAGKYEVNWDAAIYPSGIYFYKFEAGHFSHIKKMLLTR